MKNFKVLASLLVASSLFTTSSFATEDMKKWLRPTEVPQPADNKLTPERIELGKLLYFDVRLSSSEKISCATCHHPKSGWSDLKPTPKAVGHEGRVGPRNSPVVLNTAYQNRQFWDGRVRTLEQQALGPIEADVEMNMPLEVLIPKLNKIEGYKTLFAEAYPKSNGVITEDYLAKAIASFERTVVSTDAPFDRYIKGDKSAVNQYVLDGFELFKGKAHCADCHDGFNYSDGSFHNIGLNDGELHGKEQGRYLVKRRASWYGVMKTPTLRDIGKSAPYFHDGSVKTLKEATAICAAGGRYENNVKNKSTFMIDRKLTDTEINKVVAFLKSLTGPNMKLTIPTKFPQ
ncbi:MAG: cytochrome c peroxidase [Campylobacterota bacterium]|nr:cytochrome c peroxidase [Campylobacterota bacterium]